MIAPRPALIAASRFRSASRLLFLLVCVVQVGRSEELTLRRAIDLALAHSSTVGMASADAQRAYESWREAHSVYTPQVTLGSGLGYAYGFPLSLEGSAPTIFNVTAQSVLLNKAQQEFIRAAKTDWAASQAQTRDKREQVLLDVIASYDELDKWERKLPILYAEQKVTRDMQYAVHERVKEGIEAPLEETKIKLKAAQSNLHVVQAESSADVLRRHLAELTGLPAQSITTVSSSVPPLPEPAVEESEAPAALDSIAAVETANLRAEAEQLHARGEHKAFYPTADWALQYGLINTTLTNYQQFFRLGTFRPNNVTAGIVIRFPFLNSTQHARADEAAAAALSARKAAENAKSEVSDRIAKLQSTVRQLFAARDVAQVQYELAQAQLQGAQARMEGQPATLRELQEASLQAATSSGSLMDSEIELERAQLQLLQAEGKLESWSAAAR